ncbi:MAG: hypothetical protein DRJ67_10455 [Thermoprotei archaeon]|nr:MAG: hypothetical protein DRJ67_10455 [Thermoprotei archaeon]
MVIRIDNRPHKRRRRSGRGSMTATVINAIMEYERLKERYRRWNIIKRLWWRGELKRIERDLSKALYLAQRYDRNPDFIHAAAFASLRLFNARSVMSGLMKIDGGRTRDILVDMLLWYTVLAGLGLLILSILTLGYLPYGIAYLVSMLSGVPLGVALKYVWVGIFALFGVTIIILIWSWESQPKRRVEIAVVREGG